MMTKRLMRLALIIITAGASILVRTAESKFYIESCVGDGKCKALLGYRVMADTKISSVAAMFGVEADQILGANNFQISMPKPEDSIIQALEIVRIPVSCACSSNGIRRTDSITYAVREEGETLLSICNEVFSGMVTPLQIAEANSGDFSLNLGEQQVNSSQELVVGQRLIIPFPCACNGGSFKGIPSKFVSYRVQRGDSAFEIAQLFGSSVSTLVELNNMLESSALSAGDMLEIPVPACTSSFDPGADDHGLAIPKGTYEITANGCVQCFCGYNYPRLDCFPAPAGNTSCSSTSLNCNSELRIGEFFTTSSPDNSSCGVTSCSYRGFQQNLILTGLEKRTESSCPAPSPPPTYRQYKPALTPDASPIIEPQSIISNQFTPINTTAAAPPHSAAATTIHPENLSQATLSLILLAMIIIRL